MTGPLLDLGPYDRDVRIFEHHPEQAIFVIEGENTPLIEIVPCPEGFRASDFRWHDKDGLLAMLEPTKIVVAATAGEALEPFLGPPILRRAR
jgi:hypothetical protein